MARTDERSARLLIPDALVEALRGARHVVALTGAGISAESGLPTFRDPMTGLWAKYRPEDLATPEAFRRDPALVWDWYRWRRERVAEARPNPGHRALADIARRVPSFTLLTQNVDGLHQLAGSPEVIELHGNITRSKCFDHHHLAESWDDTGAVPPRCPRCGSPLRPDVVWFGESLPEAAIAAALEASDRCDLFFAIGTSGVVQPAASFAFRAQAAGAMVVIVNPDTEPSLTGARIQIPGKAGEVLPALVARTWPAA